MSEPPGTAAAKQDAPHPEDARKPDNPSDLKRPSWRYAGKKVVSEFLRDQCLDLAAGLTYYSVLALFPALLALVSLLGVFGQGQQSVDAAIDLMRDVPGASQIIPTAEPILQQLFATRAAGFALVIGLIGALWSASGYVGAFSRAMNRILEIDEGRPIWKLRPALMLLTLVVLLLVALVLVGLVVSGPVAEFVGGLIGLGSVATQVWDLAKWPVILLIVVGIVGLLYRVTPNVQQPKFRWISIGSAAAIVVWLLASAAFGFYVANFGSYNKTYGTLAGVIVFLLWLWITNNALLVGAEIDAEVERARQLQAGIEAERTLQLPPRDTTQSDKAAEKHDKLVEEGRRYRLENEAAAEKQGDA